MAQDSEKRFHQIMDKLFSSPKPTPASPSNPSMEQTSRGRKRPYSSSPLSLVEPRTGKDVNYKFRHTAALEGSQQAPLCRPWDRGDLMRRLATFKSMTWFAKPQVISAVNCARRGWVNVDIDTIGCESCGARLLFSTPASWSRQQVEKAASVFSLKLDSGHKLLCPWIDNSCDENLVEFPPMMPQDLVEKFKERSYAMLQLLALPLISPAAIEYMRSSELEQFLEQPLIKEFGNTTAEISQSESIGNEQEACSAKLYYQAQKLISLCGWEPRSLPYAVECKEKFSRLISDANVTNLSQEIVYGQSQSCGAHSADANEIIEKNENSGARDCTQYDPESAVLDCKLCGASAGLWVFSTVPRPLELLTVVGSTEVNIERNSGTHDPGNDMYHEKNKTSNLNLTIAGGPPATKQNFKATISLPVIGRNLRSRFSWDSELNNILSDGPHVAQSENRDLLESEKEDQRQGMVDHQYSSLERKTADNNAASAENDTLGANIVPDPPSESGGNDPDAAQKEIIQGVQCPEHADRNGLTRLPVKDSGNTSKGDASLTSQAASIAAWSTNQEIIPERSGTPGTIKTKASTAGYVLEHTQPSNQMEFDPIRQHRHFCPWITSTGRKKPGWQQTLSALQRQKNSPHLSPSSDSLIKVDDPITSVRNLFKSPVAKKSKPNQGSS